MATSNSFTNAPTVVTPADKKPGWFERFEVGAKHMIGIGCLGLIITIALFIYGGYLAWNGLWGSEPVTTIAHTAAAPRRDLILQVDPVPQNKSPYYTVQAGVFYPASEGEPNCANIDLQMWKHKKNGVVDGYICQ